MIPRTVWLYLQFCYSFLVVEEFQAEHGLTVTHELIRELSRSMDDHEGKKRQECLGDTRHFDEVLGTISKTGGLLMKSSIAKKINQYPTWIIGNCDLTVF